MFLLFGYLNHDNYGDELLARLVEDRIKANYPHATVERLDSSQSFVEHLKKISKAKYMIALGGLFQDHSSTKTPVYYATCLEFAKMRGVKTILLAQGIGPLKDSFSKWLTMRAFKKADFCSVRDKSSFEFLKMRGLDCFYGSDIAWSLYEDVSHKSDNDDYGVSAEHKAYIDEILSTKYNVKMPVISLRTDRNNFSQDYMTRLCEKIINDVVQDISRPCILLEMQGVDIYSIEVFKRMIDEKRAKSGLPKIQDIYLQAKDYTAQQLLYIFKEHCSFMVSMRLHALILGHIAGLQSTAIAIDPKINEFIHQIDVYKLNILRDRAVKHFDKILFLKLSDNQPNRLKKNIYKKPSLKF